MIVAHQISIILFIMATVTLVSMLTWHCVIRKAYKWLYQQKPHVRYSVMWTGGAVICLVLDTICKLLNSRIDLTVELWGCLVLSTVWHLKGISRVTRNIYTQRRSEPMARVTGGSGRLR